MSDMKDENIILYQSSVTVDSIVKSDVLAYRQCLFSYYDIRHTFRVVLGWDYRGLTGGFLLLQNFSVAISVSPHVCFILVLILISMFLR